MAKSNAPARQASEPPAHVQPPARHDANFPALLMKSQDEFAKLMRTPEMVQRFMRTALTEFRGRNELAKCTPQSIMASVMLAAQMNLEIGSAMKQCYLIPYGLECKLEVSYIGFLELSRRSGQFRDIDACIVNENDVFSYKRHPRPELYHEPNLWNPGRALGVYVYAILQNGEPKFEAMSFAEIEKARLMSRNANGGAWLNWWDQMAKKTALKRFLKTKQLTPELAMAIENDNAGYILDDPSTVSTSARVQPRRGVAGLREQLQLDEPTLPPQGTRTYVEADESSQDPGDPPDGPSGDVADYGGEPAGDDARES